MTVLNSSVDICLESREGFVMSEKISLFKHADNSSIARLHLYS